MARSTGPTTPNLNTVTGIMVSRIISMEMNIAWRSTQKTEGGMIFPASIRDHTCAREVCHHWSIDEIESRYSIAIYLQEHLGIVNAAV